ncbi:molybdopterin molybdotransferase MoeA [Sphingomicrobium sp. XHP0235]|uniref:molybdopterin molybdotransferase MoeA n=1 Tax=Sphingomicrobium aquimarinum TaxID=3133971 RepID=UPI0031FE59C2
MIDFDSALEVAIGLVGLLDDEEVSLDQSRGRILAEPVRAAHDQPPTRRSKMDGIAVADAAPQRGQRFRLVGEAPAGTAAAVTLGTGQAIKIATGGVVPEGAKRVVPRELLDDGEGEVSVIETPSGPDFIRPVGADFRSGDALLPAGTLLDAGAIALAAAANEAMLRVRRRPSIGVLTGGDELVPVGSPVTPTSAIDSVGPMLAALIEDWGGEPCRLPLLPDDPQAVERSIAQAIGQYDLLLVAGGASVGERDFVRGAVTALGGTLGFERIAMKPGKPCWCACLGETPLLGLPGNPGSAFVGAHLLLRPMMARMLGIAAPQWQDARYEGETVETGSRQTFLLSRIEEHADGRAASALSLQDSGAQSALAACDALVNVAAGSTLSNGQTARILRVRGWGR